MKMRLCVALNAVGRKMSTKGSSSQQHYCPRCKSHTPCSRKMYNTIVCDICGIIVDSPTRDKVGR